jgi:tetratricopeptide (TPR) repeat protein
MRRWRLCAVPLIWLGLVSASLTLAEDTAPAPATAPNVREILDHADKLMAGKNYRAARDEYERARALDQGSERAWRGLGWSLWQLGEKQQALQVWNDILKVLPESPSILLAMAQAHEQDRRWDEALALYGRVLKANPNHAGAREARARILRSQADTAAQTAKPEQAIAQYKRSLQERPNHRSTLKSLADLYQSTQRYAEATELLREYVSAHPADDDLREKLAHLAEYAGRHGEAESQWRTLISKHPENARYQIELARLLHAGGQTAASVAIAKDVLGREASNPDALSLMADEAFYGERPEEAVQWLDRLVAVQPTAKRLDQIGELHLTLGRKFADLDDSQGARREYAAAAKAFRRAGELEPVDVDARLGYITALRLQGRVDEAIKLAEQLHEQYPSSQRATRELYDANLESGQYERAAQYHSLLLRNAPGTYRTKREGTLMIFARGDRDQAIAALEQMRQEGLRPNVPVLLYHGITDSPTGDTTWVENFRDQMWKLKQAGYETITVRDLIDFLDGKDLPQRKPLLITFDDARADSFRNADPILKEVGFRAAMFIPAAEIDRHIPFYASWETIQAMQRSGRWEMQCHAYLAHRFIAVDEKGTKGRFNANRKWLADQGRLETEEEFAERVDEDYGKCREVVSQQVPGAEVVAYAYPFDDLGQNTLANYPAAYEVNQKIVLKHYRIAFMVAPGEFVTRDSPRTIVSRLEVPREFNGEDLLRHLRLTEPERAIRMREAEFYSYMGRYQEALAIYDTLEREDMDRATLYAAKGRVLAWRGDYASAHELLASAVALKPDDPIVAARAHDIDLHFRPLARMSGGVYSDNRDRTNTRFGPSGQVYLTPRFSLAPSYDRLELIQDHFNFARRGTADQQPTGVSETSLSDTSLRTSGNQFQAQLEYDFDWHTNASLSGGVAQFDNQSSPRVLEESTTFPLASGQVNFGFGDDVDVSLGGSYDYVPAVGAILKELGVGSSLERLRVRPTDWITLFARHSFSRYDDGNQRNTAIAQLLFRLASTPDLQIGYQLVYDNTRDQDPFFYTPDRFIANEGLALLKARLAKGLTANAAVSVGAGSERGGDAELEASAAGGLDLALGEHLGLFGRASRSQAARFRSVEGNGGLLWRF